MKIDNHKLDMAMARSRTDVQTLCESSGLSRSALSLIRNKKRDPRPATIGKIAKALDVDVTEIIEKEA
ncbi:MAG: hypothetical protein PWR12_704 [Eubacteriaceae bacterium]|jgi:transcriptional regulator with XRE-family HTH domain|nr:hypothetical protein [Eubacteriaceae bacterium]MDK2904628.1 hypothetical protein [Eubacteriaceae bacterium]MDK2935356.1 hypothetical protein [Eubacteriaceae bacterium]MDK2962054.1 hypothetical protein [Eubacteriaceae bacterium]